MPPLAPAIGRRLAGELVFRYRLQLIISAGTHIDELHIDILPREDRRLVLLSSWDLYGWGVFSDQLVMPYLVWFGGSIAARMRVNRVWQSIYQEDPSAVALPTRNISSKVFVRICQAAIIFGPVCVFAIARSFQVATLPELSNELVPLVITRELHKLLRFFGSNDPTHILIHPLPVRHRYGLQSFLELACARASVPIPNATATTINVNSAIPANCEKAGASSYPSNRLIRITRAPPFAPRLTTG